MGTTFGASSSGGRSSSDDRTVYSKFSVGREANMPRLAASLVEKLKKIEPAITGRIENFRTFFLIKSNSERLLAKTVPLSISICKDTSFFKNLIYKLLINS